MEGSLSPKDLGPVFASLKKANDIHSKGHPGETILRRPMHTLFGGAQLFRAETAPSAGVLALEAMRKHTPDAGVFARALGVPDDLAERVYGETVSKLEREPVEDFRIDFEDGFGLRPDEEEDEFALKAAVETAEGMERNSLPPFFGIRTKPFDENFKQRAVRSLDLYLTELSRRTSGRLPANFVVTLPKVALPEQVSALATCFQMLEARTKIPHDSLRMEFMIETPHLIANGGAALPVLLAAAGKRCVAAHFGLQDYASAVNVVAGYSHTVGDFARHTMQAGFAGRGIRLSDGAVNVLPVGDGRAVRDAWRFSYDHIRHSLRNGFFQGQDLHPAQLPVRYAAHLSFFLEHLPAATARLKNFLDNETQATLTGGTADDLATGASLLNFFSRALECGAATTEDLNAAGLTLDELHMRSFRKIIVQRRHRACYGEGCWVQFRSSEI